MKRQKSNLLIFIGWNNRFVSHCIRIAVAITFLIQLLLPFGPSHAVQGSPQIGGRINGISSQGQNVYYRPGGYITVDFEAWDYTAGLQGVQIWHTPVAYGQITNVFDNWGSVNATYYHNTIQLYPPNGGTYYVGMSAYAVGSAGLTPTNPSCSGNVASGGYPALDFTNLYGTVGHSSNFYYKSCSDYDYFRAVPDSTPPSIPAVSASAPGWTNLPVTITAGGSTDSQSGFDHYERKIGQGNWTVGASYTVSNAQTCLVFRAVDKLGNASPASSPVCGYSDQTAPLNPASVTETHGITDDTWQNLSADPAFTWSGASDSQSGIAGYYVYWGADSAGTSDVFQTAPNYDPPAVASGTVNYLRVRTKDNAGNLAGWSTIFTFKFDSAMPTNPTMVTESHGVSSNSWQNAVDAPSFVWSGASAASGIAGYHVYWGPFSTGTATAFQTTDSYTPAPVTESGTYYLRLQTKDNAGNLSLWGTIYTFQFDNQPPTPTLTVPAQAPLLFTVQWSGEDAHSGITDFDLQVCTAGETCGEESLAWTDFLTGTTLASADYVGVDGQAVSIRVRARDQAGNQSNWQLGPPVTTSSQTKYYQFSGQTVAIRQGDQLYYLAGDHLGSTSVVMDPSGALISETRYTPYGEVRWQNGALPTDQTYTGQRREGFGLLDYNARYYDPALGRFISADTIIPQPGSPSAWDRYAYVNSNPINGTDPSGNKPCMDNDRNGNCVVDSTYGKKPSDVPLTDAGKEMLALFIRFNSQPGWWNDNLRYSMTLEAFVGLWTLWERSGIQELDPLLVEAMKSQLYMNDPERLSREAFCTEQACFNGLFNFMGVQGGGHNISRYGSGVSHELDFIEELGEFSYQDLMARAGMVGQDILTFDPTRVAYNGDVPWNWGNDENYYARVSSVPRGYRFDQIVFQAPTNFVLFTIRQRNFWGFGR